MLREHFAAERARSSDFDRVHHTDADTPEECVLLRNGESAFQGPKVLLEPHASWVRSRDPEPSHRYYLDLLRMLDWQPSQRAAPPRRRPSGFPTGRAAPPCLHGVRADTRICGEEAEMAGRRCPAWRPTGR